LIVAELLARFVWQHKEKARLPRQAGFVINQRIFNSPP
jgi:hypothetical protein